MKSVSLENRRLPERASPWFSLPVLQPGFLRSYYYLLFSFAFTIYCNNYITLSVQKYVPWFFKLIFLWWFHPQLIDFKVQNALSKVQNLHFGIKSCLLNSDIGIFLLIFRNKFRFRNIFSDFPNKFRFRNISPDFRNKFRFRNIF